MKLTPNSNTCHCTAQFTTSSLRDLHVWVLQSWAASWFVGCVFWLKGVTQPGLLYIILHLFQSLRFQTSEQTKCIYNLTLKSLAGVGQPWVCYGLKRITQGGGEGDGGLSCAWARPEPGCPHTDRGRVQRTLATTPTLGPRTRALQIRSGIISDCSGLGPGCPHSALALHCHHNCHVNNM